MIATHAGPNTRRRSRAAGFTLIEVMVALVIISVGLMGLVALIPLGSRQVASTTQRSRASQLAASRAERLLITPYADEDLDPGSHTDDENPLEGEYWVTWVVEDNQPITGCKRVVVRTSVRSASAPALSNVVIVVPRSGG
jgi:type IV pilus assembly protein PilV